MEGRKVAFMKIEQLYYIVTIAKNNSISEAAKKLHISQSALSQSIANLEEELGLQILNRSKKGTVPTPDGEYILSLAEIVLDKFEQIKHYATDRNAENSKELRIGIVKGLHFPFFPKILSQLKEEIPNLKITLIEKGSSEIIKAINDKQVDIGILVSYENTNEPLSNLYTEILYEENLYVLFDKNSHLATYKSITPNQLVNLPFVHYNGEFMNWLFQRFVEEFGNIDVLFTTDNAETLREVIKEGLAVTIETKLEMLNNPFIKTDEILYRPLKLNIFKNTNIIVATSVNKVKRNEIKSFIKQFKMETYEL